MTRLGVGWPRTCPDLVLADKAYTSRGNRSHLRSRGIKACIPSKTDQDLYKVIRELQRLLATWTGACLTCHQPVKPLHRNKRRRTTGEGKAGWLNDL